MLPILRCYLREIELCIYPHMYSCALSLISFGSHSFFSFFCLARNLILDMGPTLLLFLGKRRLCAIFQISRGNTTFLINLNYFYRFNKDFDIITE